MNTKRIKVNSILFLVLSLFIATGCEEKQGASQAEKDEAIILAYLESHPELEATRHSSGLYYQILEPGTGNSPGQTSTITAAYSGYLTDGEVFGDGTFTASLSNLILGWQIGVPLLQKGGKAILIIPSSMGYGSSERRDIPPNSVLVFELELIDFE